MKKTIFTLALIGIALTSCNFLETENKSTVTADEQFSNASGWNQLLNQAYYNMRAIYSNPLLFCAGTDMYTVSQGGSKSVLHTYSYNADEQAVQDLYENTYKAINAANCVIKYSSDEALNDEAIFIRSYCYYVLTQQFGSVPYITQYIETAETSYPRTELNKVYDSVIADLEAVVAANRLSAMPEEDNGRGRANILAVKALLAKVCLAAGWDLNTTLTDAAQGKYTISGSAYFAKAAAYGKEVCDQIPLNQKFANKWGYPSKADDDADKGNIENLFAIQYDRASSSDQNTGGHSQQHYFGCYMGSNALGVKGMRNDLCPTERVYYAFEKGDERFEASFMTTIYSWTGAEDKWSTQGYWGYYNATDAALATNPISWKFFPWYTTNEEINQYRADHAAQFVTTGYKVPNTLVVKVADEMIAVKYNANGTKADSSVFSFDAGQSKIGYLPPCKKFDDKQTTASASQANGGYRDLIVLDASDIYLSTAEAYLLQDKASEAAVYVSKVRERAGLSTLGSFGEYKRYDYLNNNTVTYGATDGAGLTIGDIDVILEERMRETMGQYLRWMDLRRTKQLVRYCVAYNGSTVASMTGNDGNIKWLRPIPTNEIQINAGITSADQNPGF